jgi:hypothetical protein
MFDFLKSKDERFKEGFSAKLHESALKILAALNTEIDYLMFFEGKQKRDFLTDIYFWRYTFGMIDAVTTLFGLELRSKIGLHVVAMYYLRYLVQEFELKQATALEIFRRVLKFYNTDDGQRDAAILDGGLDGVLVLRGTNIQNYPQKLLQHFGVNTKDDTPVTPADFEKFWIRAQKFREFCSRDRWSGEACKEGERVMHAVISGDIVV